MRADPGDLTGQSARLFFVDARDMHEARKRLSAAMADATPHSDCRRATCGPKA